MNTKTDGNMHYSIIEAIAKHMKPRAYVELGVHEGECIRRVAPYCEKAIGVDIKRPAVVNGWTFIECDTKNISRPFYDIDLAFIDADHGAESVRRDFDGLWPSISPNGLILLHDTWPESQRYLEPGLCGTACNAVEGIKRAYSPGVEVVTLPISPGLTIIRKKGPEPWRIQ